MEIMINGTEIFDMLVLSFAQISHDSKKMS